MHGDSSSSSNSGNGFGVAGCGVCVSHCRDHVCWWLRLRERCAHKNSFCLIFLSLYLARIHRYDKCTSVFLRRAAATAAACRRCQRLHFEKYYYYLYMKTLSCIHLFIREWMCALLRPKSMSSMLERASTWTQTSILYWVVVYIISVLLPQHFICPAHAYL